MEGFPQAWADGAQRQAVAFRGKLRHAEGMDKQQHADLLRDAIESSRFSRRDIAAALDREYRTVGNWTSRTNPTMPSAGERAALRELLGDYDIPGDEVERAVRRSELIEWRQDAVVSIYKRHLYEQAQEARELG